MEPCNISFNDLRRASIVRQEEWPGNSRIDVPFRTIEVNGEAGEMVEALEDFLVVSLLGLEVAGRAAGVSEKMKKFLRAQNNIKGSVSSIDDIELEIGDTIVSLDLLAKELDIDLGECVRRAFNRTSKKYGMQTQISSDGSLKPIPK